MSSVWGMILQWGSTIKVSIEIPVATGHRRDMTEKLLKTTSNPNTHTHTHKENTSIKLSKFFFKNNNSSQRKKKKKKKLESGALGHELICVICNWAVWNFVLWQKIKVCDSCIVSTWALLIFLLCLWWPNSNFLCCVITQNGESSRDLLLSVTNRKALAPAGHRHPTPL